MTEPVQALPGVIYFAGILIGQFLFRFLPGLNQQDRASSIFANNSIAPPEAALMPWQGRGVLTLIGLSGRWRSRLGL